MFIEKLYCPLENISKLLSLCSPTYKRSDMCLETIQSLIKSN